MSRSFFLVTAVCLCALFCGPAGAQSNLGLKAVGLDVGIVNPEDMDATVGIGAVLDLGTIAPNLLLDTHFDYWSASEEQYGIEFSVRDIVFGARTKYLFDMPSPKFRPFVGGGLSLHFVEAEMTIPDEYGMGGLIPGGSVSDSSTKLGLDLGGGFFVPVNPAINFMTEMWFGVVSDVNQFSLKVGMMYNLGS